MSPTLRTNILIALSATLIFGSTVVPAWAVRIKVNDGGYVDARELLLHLNPDHRPLDFAIGSTIGAVLHTHPDGPLGVWFGVLVARRRQISRIL